MTGASDNDVYERIGTTTNRLVSGRTTGSFGGNFAYFAGAADDGLRVYFVSDGNLTSEDGDGFRFDGYERVGGVTLLATVGPGNDSVPDHGNYDVGINEIGLDGGGNRIYFQSLEPLRADDTDSVFDVYFTETSDAQTQTVPSGGTASTGTTPTETDPLETDVTPPGGGTVTIQEIAPTQTAPSGIQPAGIPGEDRR